VQHYKTFLSYFSDFLKTFSNFDFKMKVNDMYFDNKILFNSERKLIWAILQLYLRFLSSILIYIYKDITKKLLRRIRNINQTFMWILIDSIERMSTRLSMLDFTWIVHEIETSILHSHQKLLLRLEHRSHNNICHYHLSFDDIMMIYKDILYVYL